MAQQYKKGDYYIDGRKYYVYDGTSFENKGQNNGAATGRKVDPPSAAPPAGSPTASPASGAGKDKDGKATIVIRNPSINASSFKAGNAYKAGAQSDTLRYPRDPGINATSDYVMFEFCNYAPPFGRNSSRTQDTLNYTQVSGYPGYSDYMQSQERSWASPAKMGPIMMYMPEDLGDQMGADWGGAGFGATAAGLMNVAGTKTDKFTLGGFASAIPGVVKTGTFEAIRKGLNAATGSNISQNQLVHTSSPSYYWGITQYVVFYQ